MERTDRKQELKVGDTALLEGKEVKILNLRKRSAIVLKEDGLKKVVLKRLLKLLTILLLSMLLTSCKCILYKKDACGQYPKLKKVHKTYYSISH